MGKIVYQIGLTKLVADLLVSFSKAMATQSVVPGTQVPGPRAAIQTYEWTRTVTTNTLLFIDKAWRMGQPQYLSRLMVEMRRFHGALAATFKEVEGEEVPELTERNVQNNASKVKRVQKEINKMVKWYESWTSTDAEDEDDEDSSLEEADEDNSGHEGTSDQEEEADDAHEANEDHNNGMQGGSSDVPEASKVPDKKKKNNKKKKK
eukprot:460698-Rhodomonas_salina.1